MEIWKDIEGYEGYYQVSSTGKVKSLARFRLGKNGTLVPIKEKILANKISKSGYCIVGLYKNGDKKFFSVHRLVATAFIENTYAKETVNHKDGNKENNNVSNLEWSTHKEQMKHAVDNDLLEIRGSPKYSKDFKRTILEYKNDNPNTSISKLAELFGVSERTAGRIINEGVNQRPTTRVLKDGTKIVEDILSAQQVEEIKQLRSEGKTLSYIAKLYNRGTSQIHRITKGKSRNSNIE